MRFLPSQQPEELAETIRAADVCVATTRPGAFSAGTIPVKIFDYLASAKPVVAAVSGDAKALIEESGGGVVVEPGRAEELSRALIELVADEDRRGAMGEKGRRYAAANYSRAKLAEMMEDLLTEVVAAERALGGMTYCVRRYLAAKYTIDAVVALIVILVGSPLFALLALMIRLDSRGRAIFTQRRIGVHSEEFLIFKFRTMHEHAPDIATDLMMHEPRDYTTRVGRFLRRTSLDELPNFLNILKGEMSLVGPRPALYNQCELIEKRQRLGVDLVRPGLTGWAQINGRDSVTLDEKVRLDEFYVRNCSLLLDFKILLRTFAALWNPSGV